MTTMMFGEDGTASGRGACLHPNHTEATAHTEIKRKTDLRIAVILHGPIREAVPPTNPTGCGKQGVSESSIISAPFGSPQETQRRKIRKAFGGTNTSSRGAAKYG